MTPKELFQALRDCRLILVSLGMDGFKREGDKLIAHLRLHALMPDFQVVPIEWRPSRYWADGGYKVNVQVIGEPVLELLTDIVKSMAQVSDFVKDVLDEEADALFSSFSQKIQTL